MPTPSLYTIRQEIIELRERVDKWGQRIERLERIALAGNRCIKVLWVILVPVIAAVLIKWFSG